MVRLSEDLAIVVRLLCQFLLHDAGEALLADFPAAACGLVQGLEGVGRGFFPFIIMQML